MKNLATSRELLPGVYCVTDRMDMNMTLLVGSEKALLVDTGYSRDVYDGTPAETFPDTEKKHPYTCCEAAELEIEFRL